MVAHIDQRRADFGAGDAGVVEQQPVGIGKIGWRDPVVIGGLREKFDVPRPIVQIVEIVLRADVFRVRHREDMRIDGAYFFQERTLVGVFAVVGNQDTDFLVGNADHRADH